jgi:hypothetical protein
MIQNRKRRVLRAALNEIASLLRIQDNSTKEETTFNPEQSVYTNQITYQ